MSPDRLVYMANQTGKFFEYHRPEEVMPGIANQAGGKHPAETSFQGT